MDVDLRPLDAGDLARAWELSAQAFQAHPDPVDIERFRSRIDLPRTMGAFVGDELVGVTRTLALRQFFGGRAVPMGGLAGVAVAPEHRGKGYGATVVGANLRAMRERGEAVSTLYPATTRLYRGLGWEVGGAYVTRSVPTRSLNLLPAGATDVVRRATVDDVGALQALYGGVAVEIDGHIDRNERQWAALLGPEAWEKRFAYVVEDDRGEPAGYVVYHHVPSGHSYTIEVDDLVAGSADAAVALWRLLGSSASQARTVTYQGAPEDPLLLLLPEQDVRTVDELRWMTRLVDVGAAVTARGYPPAVRATVDLAVRDRHCDWNDGSWRLHVEDGHGSLERGGTGAVRIGVGALASLWTGYASARTLRRAGLLVASSPADLAALDAMFSGPTPWMPDFF